MFLAAVAFPAAASAQQIGPPSASDQGGGVLQTPGIDLGGTKRVYTPEEKERMEQIDKDYQATMKKVPDKPKAYDPWAGARQNSSSKR